MDELRESGISESLELEGVTPKSERRKGNYLPLTTKPSLKVGITGREYLNTPLSEKAEVDLENAYLYVDQLLALGTPITESTVSDLHIISARSNIQVPIELKGKYDLTEKSIRRVPWPVKPFAKPRDVPERMKEFANKYANAMTTDLTPPDTVRTAMELMVELVDIHPFIDGNGRLSRIIADSILMKHGLPQMKHWYKESDSIPVDNEKLTFLHMVEKARNGDYSQLLNYFTNVQIEALQSDEGKQIDNMGQKLKALGG